MHLAELNIAEWLISEDDPRAAGFMNNLGRINALAERTPGFVWRLKDDTGNATSLKTPWPDNFVINMSVWQTPEQLEHYVWNTVHKKIYEQRKQWFEVMSSHHFVMWWVEEGHEPSLEEAKARLDHLDANGNSDEAFDWAHLPHVKLWQTQACG